MAIAGLGDAAASDGFATRSLPRNQAEIGHELARVCKASEIAHFRDQHLRSALARRLASPLAALGVVEVFGSTRSAVSTVLRGHNHVESKKTD